MAVKKPIVLYGGLMKQLQPGDTTPGQHDASIALSYAKLASSGLEGDVSDLSIASSICCSSGRSVALRAESWAEAAESIARALDLEGTASYAYSLAYRAESLGQWAENRASNALSMAKEAVEISDISEAASVGMYGVSVGRVAEDKADGAQSTGIRAESLAREASISAGGGLDAYSIADSTAQYTYSTAVSGAIFDVDVKADAAQSTGVRAESLARKEAADAESSATHYASVGLASINAGGSEAVAELSLATSEGFVDHGVLIGNSQSTAVRAESLARKEAADAQSAAIHWASVADVGFQGDLDSLSEASSECCALGRSFAVVKADEAQSAAVWYTSVADRAYSIADSEAQYAYSTAVSGQFTNVSVAIAQGDSEASSIGIRAESIANAAQKAEHTYFTAPSVANRTGMLVYKTGTAGIVALAKADNEATMPAFAIVTKDGDSFVNVKMIPDMIQGAKLDSSATPLVGSNLFVSSLQAGRMTNLAPEIGVTQRVGSANTAPSSANIDLNFRIGEPIVM